MRTPTLLLVMGAGPVPGYSLVPELQAELPAAPSGANEMQMKRRREGFWERRPSCQDLEMAFSANSQP